MNKKYKSKIIFLLLLICLLTQCNSNIKDNNQRVLDSIFLSQYNSPKLLNIFLEKNSLITKVLDDNLIINIDYLLNFKTDSNSWCFYINELDGFKKNNYLFYLNYDYLNFIPNYDSLYYDLDLLVGATADYNIERCTNPNYYTNLFSEQFFNLPELRKNDSLYQKYFKDETNLKRLEKIINNMNVFKNFEITNFKQVDLLTKIVLITLIQPLSIDPNDIDFNLGYINENFRLNNIIKIKNQESLNYFKEEIEEEVYNDGNFVRIKWDKENKDFLKSNFNYIESDYLNPNIFYFYSYDDLKLIKIIIEIDEVKEIKIKIEYINKEYLWFNNKNVIFYPKILL